MSQASSFGYASPPSLRFTELRAQGLDATMYSQLFALQLRSALTKERVPPEIIFDQISFDDFVAQGSDSDSRLGDRYFLQHAQLGSSMPIEIGAQHAEIMGTESSARYSTSPPE